MHKKFVLALCAILIGLSIYSCSELILPKQIKVKGTLDFPARIGSASLSSMIAEKIHNIFSADAEGNTKVYTVDYKGQTVQTFCIYIPIEMTEELNPSIFLKTIDKQINDGINAEPKKIDVSIPYFGVPIPVEDIKLVNNIPPVSLINIAEYVISIDFDKCEETIDSGIGLNFFLTEAPPGLSMRIKCDELKFSTDPKELKQGNNIFGNKEQLSLDLVKYKVLYFSMILESDGPDPDVWDPADFIAGDMIKIGDMIEIKGEMRFFRAWTKAEIDLSAAIKASSKIDDLTGKFPDTVFNLSEMGKYLNGKFVFHDMEVKIYMDGPNPDHINALESKLLMQAQYHNDKKKLYDDVLFINSEPLKLDDYLNEEEIYKKQHLPGNTSEFEYENKIEDDTISDIFKTMPEDLYFTYSIIVDEDKVLTVYPDTFTDDFGNSSENNRISITLMIMLPMSLTATGDDEDRSTIFIPDTLGNGDLFGRKNPDDLDTANIDYIKLTVELADKIFTKGYLFINEDKDLFPKGIKLNGKKTVVYAAHEEFERMREKLIFPDIRIEIDNGGMVNIPKKMGTVDIKVEMKSLINLGEL